MSAAVRPFTANELLRLTGDGRREVIRGELRTMAPAGFDHGVIIMKLARLLANHVEAKKLGVVLGAETGFMLARNPDTVRGADVAFVALERIASGSRPHGFWEGAPDLAVEIISPSDTVEEIDEKVNDYLSAGCRLVWVVYPKRRYVIIHRRDADPAIAADGQSLDGQDVVPGFTCQVGEIFA